MNELSLGLTPKTGYGTFRDEAARKQAQRYGRRERRRRKINMLAAAFLLASAGFGATMLTNPPTSQASLSSQNASCIKAGQSLEPWFRAELDRRAWAAVARQDDFTLMLAWFREAQHQCATGLTQAASRNLQAVAERILAREQRQRADD